MAAPGPASAPPTGEYAPASAKIPVKELLPYCACICCMTSLYTEFPDCIGCAGKRVCLCCYSEFFACKLPAENEDIWCLWDKGKTWCGPVETLCMQRAQVFCCDVRCSIPLSDDIPVLMTCCFFTFFFREECGPFSCFRTIKEIEEDVLALSSPPTAPVRMAPQPPPPAQPAAAPSQVSSGTQTTSPMTAAVGNQ